MTMPSKAIFVSVQAHNFCLNEQQQALFESCNANAEVGAAASFVGLVRAENNIMETGQSHSGELRALYIEHYPAMTELVLRRLCEEASEKWQLITCRVIHRVGYDTDRGANCLGHGRSKTSGCGFRCLRVHYGSPENFCTFLEKSHF